MIHTRVAESSDFPAIFQLMKNELGYPNLDETEALKRLEYFKQSDDWETFVAVTDDVIAGFIGVMKGMAYNIEGHYAEIVTLAVSEKTRRGGVGTALVKRAEEWALQNGVHEVGLHSNMKRLEAHIFYEKNGYAKKSYWFYKKLEEHGKTEDSPKKIQFVVEKEPSQDSINQIVSMVQTYEGEYFTDFAEGVRIDAPFQRLCYLKYGDEMVSVIMFTCLDGYPHITVMATKRDLRNKSYGKQLMSHFVEYVSQLGFHGIELYAWSEKTKPVCASTQAFYKSVGFTVESEHMSLWAPGMITVKMKKSW